MLLPVFNEAGSIDECLQSLEGQDYAGEWDLVVADGGSTDATPDHLARWRIRLPRLRVVDNPRRLQSHALNVAADNTAADVLIRADAHTTYGPDYLTRSVQALLASGAAAVGGPMRPQGDNAFGRAVAAAYRSKFGIGPAPFHHTEQPTEGDTVYLGTMTRETFLANGGMRSLPSRVAEDADFFYRLRQRGGRILIDPSIRTTYRPRSTPTALWRQFYRYGLGKADMLYINGEFPTWRPLAPLALVLGLVAAIAFGLLTTIWWPLLLLIVGWILVLALASRGRVLEVFVIAIMHVSYGVGLVRGLLRSPRAVRAQVG